MRLVLRDTKGPGGLLSSRARCVSQGAVSLVALNGGVSGVF